MNKKNHFSKKFTIVLVNPINQGNIGAVARSMANFDFTKLAIIGKTNIEEARKRAKHAGHILDNAKHYENFEVARKEFDTIIGTSGIIGTDDNLARSPLLIEEAIKKIEEYDGKIGLFFGPEDKGLTKEELIMCDLLINIPCSNKYQVMNISHALTIILYEFFKAYNENTLRKKHALASTKEKDVTYEVIKDIIKNMSFKAESDKETQKKLWRRILGKSFITKREISSMLGFFRNVEYTLKNKKK